MSRAFVLAQLKLFLFICTKCSTAYTYVLLPSPTDAVRIQLEAGAVALGSFYASPLSSGVSNMIKLLQPTMTGTSEKNCVRCWSFLYLFSEHTATLLRKCV